MTKSEAVSLVEDAGFVGAFDLVDALIALGLLKIDAGSKTTEQTFNDALRGMTLPVVSGFFRRELELSDMDSAIIYHRLRACGIKMISA